MIPRARLNFGDLWATMRPEQPCPVRAPHTGTPTSKAAAKAIEPSARRAKMLTSRHALVGRVFERLTVVGVCAETFKLRCRCSCGVECLLCRDPLVNGNTRSCGCLQREVASRLVKTGPRRTHGLKGTHIYRVWSRMKERCLYQKHKSYAGYGGRGIKVCERWMNSVEAFIEDMGECPSGMSLDRIDVNGNYEPANCRWADSKTQQRNKRDNHLLTAFGETKTMADWVEDDRCMTNYHALAKRLEAGMSDHEAITIPTKKRKNGRPRGYRATHSGRQAVVWGVAR